MPGVIRRVVVVGLMLVVGGLTAGTAGAQGEAAQDLAEAIGLSTSAGYGGVHAGTEWVPVTVTIAPERLFSGRLEVTGRGPSGEVVEARDVEVAGGGRKEFRFLLPSARDVLVEASADGGGSATARAQIRELGEDDLLVGVLGGAPSDAPLVETRPTGLTVTYATVDPVWPELSPRALHGVDSLVAPAPALAELTEQARRNLATAVHAGLELIVTGDGAGGTTPLDLAGLPEMPASSVSEGTVTAAPGVWTMPVGARVEGVDPTLPLVAATTVGRGRVTVAGASLGGPGPGRDAAFWGQLLGPGAHRQFDHGHETGLSRTLQSAQQALSGNTLGLPSLPWLAGFLVVYVLVVGPVNGMVLARAGRRELAWVTVPAITLLFAGGAFVAATASAPQTGLSGRIAYWIEGAGTDVAIGAVRAPTPGRHVVAFGDGGWDVLPTSFREPAEIRNDRADTEVSFDLESLEVGVAVGWRSTAAPAPLAVDAVTTDEAIEVTVRNVGDSPLDDVEVTAATEQRGVGRLEPGASTTVTVGQRGMRPVDPWNEHEGLRMGGPDAGPELPQALEQVLLFQVMDRAPGLVWATAVVTDGPAGPRPTINGRSGEDVGTLVAVAEPARIGGATVPAHAVARTVASVSMSGNRGPGWWPGPNAIEGAESVVLRYRLPHIEQLQALTGTLEAAAGPGGIDVAVPHAVEPAECEPGATCEEHHTECGPDGCVDVTRRITCERDGTCSIEEERCDENGNCSGSIIQSVGAVEAEEPPSPEPTTVEPPAPVPAPRELRGGGTRVEIWDASADAWVALPAVFDAGAGDARAVNALGEVYVRVRGQEPFIDFSGRGIGAFVGGAR